MDESAASSLQKRDCALSERLKWSLEGTISDKSVKEDEADTGDEEMVGSWCVNFSCSSEIETDSNARRMICD